MITDKELADKIIAFGIGVYLVADDTYLTDDNSLSELDLDSFIQSWEIVGATLELCHKNNTAWDELSGYVGNQIDWDGGFTLNNVLANPRMILEACIGVLMEMKS